MKRIGLSLFGPIPAGRVSGLAVFQRRLEGLLRDAGLDVVPFFFTLDRHVPEDGRVIPVDRRDRPFFLAAEGAEHGLTYSRQARRCVDRLLALFSRERLDGLFILEWMPTGMALWEAALQWGKPIVFLPSEHGAVCPYGFLLHNPGSTCVGPGDGARCARCTHSLEPTPESVTMGSPWYSERHRAFHRVARALPGVARSAALWTLSELAQPGRVVLRADEGRARVDSARRFLSNVTVAYQSRAQHQVFCRALGAPDLPAPLPAVVPFSRLPGDGTKDVTAADRPVRFAFAARPDFDRGLWLLLDAWERWAPAAETAELVVATHPLPWMPARLEALRRKGLAVEVQYGVLGEEGIARLQRRTHFYVNPVVWEEPGSSSVLEGFMFGTPAIVPGGTGSADLVRDGENGLLYPFRAPAALAATLQRAVSMMHAWARMVDRALQTAAQQREVTHDWVASVARSFDA